MKEEEVQEALALVIEVTSPYIRRSATITTKTRYARHGVREYWIVDPKARTVEVFTLREKGFELVRAYKAGEVLSSPLLEGLEVDLKMVF